MTIRTMGQWHKWLGAAALAAALAACAAGPSPARAHIVPVADMMRGIHMTPAQCAAIPMTVWVTTAGRGFCMRYYLSNAGGRGDVPLVFLQGDYLGPLNLKTGAWSPGPNEKDINTDDLMKTADAISKRAKTTAIYLGRVGVEGSSGDNRIRHSLLELHVTYLALDQIKRRYNFRGFHLVGQSGGSKLIGGLLAIRQDLGCAVIGSGRMDSGKAKPASDPAKVYFNVVDSIPTILARQRARIILVTDPADKKVPVASQTVFAKLMRQGGRPVEQYFVQAIDDNHHGVLAYALLAASECIHGANSQRIAHDIQDLVQKRVAQAQARKAKTNAGSYVQQITPPKPNLPSRPSTATVPYRQPAAAPYQVRTATPAPPVQHQQKPTPVGAMRFGWTGS